MYLTIRLFIILTTSSIVVQSTGMHPHARLRNLADEMIQKDTASVGG